MSQTDREGWSNNITKRRDRTHYYKNGISLCGLAVAQNFMRSFDKERIGDKYFMDCEICIKKQKELNGQD